MPSAGDVRDAGLIPGSGRSPWGGNRQPTPVFLPGEAPGQRSLEDHSPQGGKELDTTEWLSTLLLLLWPSFAGDTLSFDWREFSLCGTRFNTPLPFQGLTWFLGPREQPHAGERGSPRARPSAVWPAQRETNALSQNRDTTTARVPCTAFNEAFGF